MRVLRCAWPIAGVLLVSLASAGTAWGEGNQPAAELRPAAAAGAERDTSFRLFGKTWCLGEQSNAARCDFMLPAREAAASEQAGQPASAAGEGSLDRFLTALRRMFGGSATESATATGPAAGSATSGG
jgi:hypothetical protein